MPSFDCLQLIAAYVTILPHSSLGSTEIGSYYSCKMMKLVALVLAVLQFSCTLRAQPSGQGTVASGSAMLSRPCHAAGYSSCCRGRNDSCLGTPQVCYCDEYCLHTNTDDCCEDLVMGLLRCGELF